MFYGIMPYNAVTKTFEPLTPASPWNTLRRVVPHSCVMGVAVDKNGYFPIIHRSKEVRSARDRWSFPSGLHEVGLTQPEQLSVELKEELGLATQVTPDGLMKYCELVGNYENIVTGSATEPPWHWVISVFVIQIEDAHAFVNSEPDKHDKVRVVHYNDFYPSEFNWTDGLWSFVDEHIYEIRAMCHQVGVPE